MELSQMSLPGFHWARAIRGIESFTCTALSVICIVTAMIENLLLSTRTEPKQPVYLPVSRRVSNVILFLENDTLRHKKPLFCGR